MGALQGIGTSAAFAQPTPWGNPWSTFTQGAHPYAQSFGSPQQQLLQQQQILQSLQVAVQQALYAVPQQLHQIQQLVQLLAQQSYQLQQLQQLQATQPFQIPSFGLSPWLCGAQSGQPQLFGGPPGYVM